MSLPHPGFFRDDSGDSDLIWLIPKLEPVQIQHCRTDVFWFYTHRFQLFLELPSFRLAVMKIFAELHLRNLQMLPGEFLRVRNR